MLFFCRTNPLQIRGWQPQAREVVFQFSTAHAQFFQSLFWDEGSSLGKTSKTQLNVELSSSSLAKQCLILSNFDLVTVLMYRPKHGLEKNLFVNAVNIITLGLYNFTRQKEPKWSGQKPLFITPSFHLKMFVHSVMKCFSHHHPNRKWPFNNILSTAA